MGKVLKIVMWIVVLAILYIWMTTAFNSCGNKAADATGDLVEGMENTVNETGEAISETTEELFENEDIDYSEIENDDSEFEVEEPVEEEEFVEETIVEEKPRASYSSITNGEYMIIAGNYLVESNASEMAKKLQNMGYSGAEKVIFDASSYHTVIASRYSDYGEAVRTASNLKAKGIDCYVKKRT